MATITVQELRHDDVRLAVELLYERHRAYRSRFPHVATPAAGPTGATAALEHALASGVALGAWRDTRLVGFVVGEASGRFGLVPAGHHAVDPAEADVAAVYGALYAQLCERWVETGCTVHDVELPALRSVEEAWSLLGFGRRLCVASRTSAALPARQTDVVVRRAGREELDTIARLSALEVEHRTGTPMFLEGGPPRIEAVRQEHANLLDQGAVHLLASLDGEDVGLLTMLGSGRFSLLGTGTTSFIGTTATEPAHRGRGVGRALVESALSLARERGDARVDLSFQTASPLARPFWLGLGWEPLGWKVARRLPETTGDSRSAGRAG